MSIARALSSFFEPLEQAILSKIITKYQVLETQKDINVHSPMFSVKQSEPTPTPPGPEGPSSEFTPFGIGLGSVLLFFLILYAIVCFVLTIVRKNYQPVKARSFALLLCGQFATSLFSIYVATRILIPVPLYPCAVFTFIMVVGEVLIWVYPVASSIRTLFIICLRLVQLRIDEDVINSSYLNPKLRKLKQFLAFMANSWFLLLLGTILVLLSLIPWGLVTWLVDDGFLKLVPQCGNLNLSLMYASIVYNTIWCVFLLICGVIMIIAMVKGLFNEHYNLAKEMLAICCIWLFYEVVTLVTLLVTPAETRVSIIPRVIGPVTIFCMSLQTFICVIIPIIMSFFWNTRDISKIPRVVLTIVTCSTLFWRGGLSKQSLSEESEKKMNNLLDQGVLLTRTILYDKEIRNQFKEHCKKEFCDENNACLELLEASINNRSQYNYDVLCLLRDTYINVGSAREVNITEHTRRRFIDALEMIKNNTNISILKLPMDTPDNAEQSGTEFAKEDADTFNVALNLRSLRDALIQNLVDPFGRFFSVNNNRKFILERISGGKEEKSLGLV